MTTPEQLVTDGGLETDLIFNHGIDLPDFAAFPLLGQERGRALLRATTRIRRHRRARPAPGWCSTRRPGGPTPTGPPVSVTTPPRWPRPTATPSRSSASCGTAGPTGLPPPASAARSARAATATVAGAAVDPDEAAAYHRPQIAAFAEAGADVITALTLTDVGEALGSSRRRGTWVCPVAISFTVETDGRLPGGTTLAEAIGTVDAAGGPAYFLVNCAHPEHIERGLGEDGPWRERIRGLRVNASTMSHAELDDSTELDAGDPVAWTRAPAARALAAVRRDHRRMLRHGRPARRGPLARPRGRTSAHA